MVRKYKTSAIQIIYIFLTINHQQHPKPWLKSCECGRSRDGMPSILGQLFGSQPFSRVWEAGRGDGGATQQPSRCGGEHFGLVPIPVSSQV